MVCGSIGNTERMPAVIISRRPRRISRRRWGEDCSALLKALQFHPASTRSWRRSKRKNRVFRMKMRVTRFCRYLHLPGQDLNLHALRRYHLKVVRLPISPPGLYHRNYTTESFSVERTVRLGHRFEALRGALIFAFSILFLVRIHHSLVIFKPRFVTA